MTDFSKWQPSQAAWHRPCVLAWTQATPSTHVSTIDWLPRMISPSGLGFPGLNSPIPGWLRLGLDTTHLLGRYETAILSSNGGVRLVARAQTYQRALLLHQITVEFLQLPKVRRRVKRRLLKSKEAHRERSAGSG